MSQISTLIKIRLDKLIKTDKKKANSMKKD